MFAAVSRIIAVGFFLFSKKVAESNRFYALLYPDKSWFYHRVCTFQQYQNFTSIHYDRLLAGKGLETVFQSEGWEKLGAVQHHSGAILLMSHLGNWEMAAHLLKQQVSRKDILLYMGVKEKEGVEAIQKKQLLDSGVKIIGVQKDGWSPFDALEGIRFLQDGGIVSMAGDIVWHSEQRSIEVDFMGRKVELPEAPYIFALVSGVPILCFFSFRVGQNRYTFRFADPIYILSESRTDRHRIIRAAAQQYADLLEEELQAHPLQWYHFDRFVK